MTASINYLQEQQNKDVPDKVYVHNDCRRDFTNALRINTATKTTAVDDSPKQITLRSDTQLFELKDNCVFCAAAVTVDKKHSDRNVSVHKVGILPLRSKILKACVMKGKINGQMRCIKECQAA